MRSFMLPFVQTDSAKHHAFERLLLFRMRATRGDPVHIAEGHLCD
jgi:hypothetical protein